MQVQHPRATPADGRRPPSKVTVPGHGNILVEDGYLDVDDEVAERAMSVLADAYDVEYTADGDVVFEEDGPPDDVSPPFDPSELTVDDLEARLADGDYSDAELAALADAEERKTGLDAIESQRED